MAEQHIPHDVQSSTVNVYYSPRVSEKLIDVGEQGPYLRASLARQQTLEFGSSDAAWLRLDLIAQ